MIELLFILRHLAEAILANVHMPTSDDSITRGQSQVVAEYDVLEN